MAYRKAQGPSPTLVARLETSEKAAVRISESLTEEFTAAEAAVSLSDAGRGRWQVAIYFLAAHDEKALRALIAGLAGRQAAAGLRFEQIVAKDWVGDSLAGLKPVSAGRFVVHGAHDRARVSPNRVGIEIEAALAFGTGHHGTTFGCLFALDRICKQSSRRRGPLQKLRILDLGTGSGVLAIAAARALRHPVLATDIDPSAVRVAGANARLNRVGGIIEVVKADGAAARSVRRHAPFSLIFANILLRPLQRLAAPLKAVMAPGGRIVLSGLLSAQTNAVIAAYRPLALEQRIDLDGWTTLVFKRHGRPRRAVARAASAP
jgi:ribosomal protein L11 methyltransferase